MRFLKFAVLAALFALPVSSVDAGIFGSLLSANGIADVIADDSAGSFIERGNIDGTLEVGDLLQGMISFDSVATNGVPAGSSLIAAYSFEVLEIGEDGSYLELGAASGTDNVLDIVSNAGVDISGLTGAHVGQDNAIVLLQSSSVDVDRNDFLGPNFGFTPGSGATAADFDPALVLGFDGVDDQHTVTAANIPTFGLVDLTDLSTAAFFAGQGTGPIASFFGTYSITDTSNSLSALNFLPLVNPLGGAVGDVTISNGTINATDSVTSANSFDFNDDGDFLINAVPEPSTVAIFGCVGLIGLFDQRRRRQS